MHRQFSVSSSERKLPFDRVSRNWFKELLAQRGPTAVPEISIFPVISAIRAAATRVWKRRHVDTGKSRA
jgi:hypothetical protein